MTSPSHKDRESRIGHDLGDFCDLLWGDASRHGLAGPEGLEPPSRLHASHGIPIAEKRK